MAAPPASFTVAVNVCVAPTLLKATVAGRITIVDGCCATLTAAFPVMLATAARTVVLPLPAAVMRPALETVATLASSVVQITDAPVIGALPASRTVTTTVCVSPTLVNASVVGSMLMVAGCCATVTATLALMLPTAARIVAVPLPTAAMTPALETVATFALSVVQVTAVAIVAPCWSFTVAVTVVV
jgi:hypothetical protein